MEKINFARGKTIFKKGDKADGLYIVGNGSSWDIFSYKP